MKITAILLCFLVTMSTWGGNVPDFDETIRVLTIPRGTSDKKNVFNNIQILLNLDHTWKTLALEPEPDDFLSGDWGGSLTEPSTDFSVPLPFQW